MTMLTAEIQCDEITKSERDEAAGYAEAECTVRISNDAAENGYDQEPGPLTWLNSARITTDPNDDAVHCLVSVGDPRGAFCFTVRRLQDGRLMIHMPYPGESMPHEATKQIHDGTLEVVHHNGEPISFADPEPEEDEDD